MTHNWIRYSSGAADESRCTKCDLHMLQKRLRLTGPYLNFFRPGITGDFVETDQTPPCQPRKKIASRSLSHIEPAQQYDPLSSDQETDDRARERVQKLIKPMLDGKKRIPRLRPEMLARLTFFENAGNACSLCGAEIGPRDKDPRWNSHDPRCRDGELCESPLFLWSYPESGILRFHSLCFLKVADWRDTQVL